MRALIICLTLVAGSATAQDLHVEGAPPGASSCTGCHGAASAMPLDGWTAEDIAAAMAEWKAGTREGTLMPRIAAGFTEDEIAAIAGWLAGEGTE